MLIKQFGSGLAMTHFLTDSTSIDTKCVIARPDPN